MAINRPRRIFRSAFPRLPVKGALVVLGIGLVAATGVSLAMLPPHRSAPAPAAEELDAQPTQVAVVDAGTLRLRDRVVRLQGVEPPARGTSCTHVGSGDDCGAAATNALAALVRDVPIACRVTGADATGRPFAVCLASGTELNRAVIAAGWARADRSQPALKSLEDTARAERRGVWASNASW